MTAVPGERAAIVPDILAMRRTSPETGATPNFVRRRCEMTELSELDAAILRELQENARRTNRAIADAVHVAPSTSLERIRSLRERGVVRGYHAEVDLAALGRNVQALIAIRIRPPSRENIESFRDWAHRPPRDGRRLRRLRRRRLPAARRRAGHRRALRLRDRPADRAAEVADVNTSVVYEHLRNHVSRAARPDRTRCRGGLRLSPTTRRRRSARRRAPRCPRRAPRG